ncbi:hypothetical protein [Fictibacillus barbaricus]|uniref:Core-binding (CB) domain-containing protein n=2 Tax=Fictibacillus barbaricus TaxID=182136 RepID=A0ABS2ZK09_9BACL|nr:hypothetical protein [Fictibacillus barbaricus]MBN3547977.1 hypothetical protein [Fictibacillus barbaricus]
MEFKDFLIKEYRISEKSARDYVGRLNGIIARGIYQGEKGITPSMNAAIKREFPNSKGHYLLTLERFIDFQLQKEY